MKAKLEFITEDSEDFLCHRYKLLEIPNEDDLIATYRQLSKEHPGFRFLLTLDDLGQACYTSMHSKMSHDLDEIEGHELPDLPPHCFEEGEHIGTLTTPAEFFIRVANFMKGLKDVTFDDIYDKEIGLFEQSSEEFINANRDLREIVDEEAYFLKVPVKHSYETIMAFPNGYFTCDLNPFENYLLAKTLHDDFGYELFGVGASHIAFLKTNEFSDAKLKELVSFLARTYRNPFDAALIETIGEIARKKEVVVLRYTE